jgi:subtilisin family serine protease
VSPDLNIRSTSSSGYSYLTGTSATAPLVAGVVANMIAVNRAITLSDLSSHLEGGADQVGPRAEEFIYDFNGFVKYYGHGRKNAFKGVYLAKHGVAAGTEPEELCEDPNSGADPNSDDFLLIMPALLAAACKAREDTSNPCN